MSNSNQHITKTSVLDGLFYSVMVGVGETYFVAFALALGIRDSIAGLISVVPLVVGSILQIFAVRMARNFKSGRIWVVACAVLQVIAMALMAALSLIEVSTAVATMLIFAFASLYWCAAQSAGPIWNVWICGIIPQGMHLNFFVNRTKICQLFTLVGLLVGGFTLRFYDEMSNPLIGFAMLFFAGALCRVASAYYIYIQAGAEDETPLARHFTGREKVSRWMRRPDVFPILLFLFITNLATYYSAPFFSPFMLGPLKLGYADYTVLISAAFLARVGLSPLFYGIARRFGVRALVLYGAFTVIPLPYLWTLSTDFTYLLILQLFSGFAWGSHELGVTLYLIEKLPHHERSRLLSWANALNSIGMLIGCSIGAYVIASSAATPEGYIRVFTVSSILRIFPIALLSLWIYQPVRLRLLSLRLLGVRAGGHAFAKPLLLEDKTTISPEPPQIPPKSVNQ